MSIKIINRVWDTPCRTHTQKLVLIALADNSNDQRICWPSIDYLAKRCDLSRQGVMNQIESLIAAGILKVKKSDGRVNVYELFPEPVNAVDQSTPLTPPVHAVKDQSTPSKKPVNAVDPNHKEPPFNHQEPSVRARFSKPSMDEIKEQAAKIGLPQHEADKFFNYYESNGWKVGKNAMKSWPHALQNWKNNAPAYTRNGAPTPDKNALFKQILREI